MVALRLSGEVSIVVDLFSNRAYSISLLSFCQAMVLEFAGFYFKI